MPRTRRAERQSPPIRYKVPFLADQHQNIILKGFLLPKCKRACREIIDVAFKRLQTVLAGGRYVPEQRIPWKGSKL
jgi:hypothetical protein